LDASPIIHTGTKTLEKVEKGKAFRMDNINYGVNSSELLQESKYILDAFADYLREQSGLKMEIRGHTDNRGNPADNLALSADRAFAVYSYLLSKGISNKQISFKGFGDKVPLVSNETEEGRNRNRRTEFYILPN
jgi:outer membrane protein OmpA-like peptidoglycan-associated protein